MTKEFTFEQLFSLLDGRMSTKIDDIYDMLNHICDTSLMTHDLPVAFNYLKLKNPTWFIEGQKRLSAIASVEFNSLNFNTVEFEPLINVIKQKYNDKMEIPQLKDEFNISDFNKFMLDNNLLFKMKK